MKQSRAFAKMMSGHGDAPKKDAGRLSVSSEKHDESARGAVVSRVSSHWEDLPASELTPLSADGIAMPFVEGEVIQDKYQVVRLIGSGGMGFVVSAIHLELCEPVALKFLRPEAQKNEEIVMRFAREAQAAARIKSEHVARVFDVSRLPDGTPFIVMEHLEGKDLCDYLGERGPLSVRLAVDYTLQACEALAAAHAVGIVHRDIKPENLFLAGRAQGIDVVKVLDFGISKVALTGGMSFTGSSPLVRTQIPMGSPVYMSPEQIRDTESVDARTDIWSLGCVLMELLTGKPAFDAPSIMQLSATILEKDAPRLRSRLPEAPEELENLLARCLERDVSRRFHSVAELAVALYPFGSRRARLSAERCCHLLEGKSELELPTLPPPTSGTPNSAPASRVVPSAMGAGALSAGIKGSDPAGPPAVAPAVVTPVETRSKGGGGKIAAVVAVLLAAGAVAAYVLTSRGGESTSVVAGSPPGVAADAPKAAAVAPPSVQAAEPASADESAARGDEATPDVAAKSPAVKRAKRAGAARPAGAKDKPKAAHSDDVDVGF